MKKRESPTKVRTTVWIDEKKLKELKIKAIYANTTLSNLLVRSASDVDPSKFNAGGKTNR